MKNQSTVESHVERRRSLVARILNAETGLLTEELSRILKDDPELKVPLEEAIQTAARYKLDLHRRFGRDLERFYARFLRRCLSDRVLTAKEKDALRHLKLLLGLSDKTVERIHNHVSQSVYRRTVEEVLKDRRITARERSFLKSLQQELKLSDRLAEKIYRDEATELVRRSLIKALADERLSPAEERELAEIAKNLGATLEYDEKTRALLDKYRLYWLIENGQIPEIDTVIRLQKREKCFFSADASLCELTKTSRSSRFGGVSDRLNRTYEPSEEHFEEVKTLEASPIDHGMLYLTNKRIVFRGAKTTRNIFLASVLDYIPFPNGIRIHRKSGKRPFFRLDSGVDVFSMMLTRLLRDLPGKR